MDLWRLQIKRKAGIDEIIDLHRKPRVYAGDDSANEVCVATTSIPNKLKLIQVKRGYPHLQLTDETIGSLEGSFEKVSEWKSKLYQGQIVKITGEASWTLADTDFRIYKSPQMAMSAFKDEAEPLARKHFWQAVGMSTSSHLMILLMLFVANLIVSYVESSLEEELQVEKVTLAQVDDLFKAPEPEPEEVVEAEVNQEPALADSSKPPQDVSSGAVKVPPKKNIKERAKRPRAAAKSSVKKEGRKVESMGLLAIQGAASTTAKNVNLKARSTAGEGDSGVARDFNPTGTGIHSGKQSYQVAQIDGFSAGAYRSGQLGDKVAAETGPAVRLVRKEIEIRGGLDKGIVRSIVEERLPELQYCYENALLKDQAYGGKMMAAWTIQADGSVDKLSSNSQDMKGNEFHSCIRSRIAQWKFPNPKGGGVVDVKYPFVFSSLGG